MQCLGFNVESINTITLSNHPGSVYKTSQSQSIDSSFYKKLITGLESNKLLNHDIVLTGYTNTMDILKEHYNTIKLVKKYNKQMIYICDPVLGDHGKFYVPENLLYYYKTHLLPLANVITPNQFEIEQITNIKINNINDIHKTCHFIHTKYPNIKVCILKGIHFANGKFSMIVSYNNSEPKEKNLMTSSGLDKHMHRYDYMYSAMTLLKSYNLYQTSSSSSSAAQNNAKDTSEGLYNNNNHQEDIIIYKIDINKIESRQFSGCGDLVSAMATAFVYYLYQVQNQLTLQDKKNSDTTSSTTTTTSSATTTSSRTTSSTIANNNNNSEPSPQQHSKQQQSHHRRHILKPYIAEALESVADTVHQVLQRTDDTHSPELCIIESADIFIQTKRNLHQLVTKINNNTINKNNNNVNNVDAGHTTAATNITDISCPQQQLSTSTAIDPSSSIISHSPSVYLSSSSSSSSSIDRSVLINRSNKIKGQGLLGIIFDMDGTLTKEGAIDFTSMYTRTRLIRDKVKGDILSQIKGIADVEERKRCYEVIYEEEMKGCEKLELREGFYELFNALYEHRIRTAVATRNCHDAALKFLEKSKLPSHM